MVKVKLKSTFVNDVTLKNEQKAQQSSIRLQQKFTHNVKYTANNICRSELTSIICSEDNENFNIKFTTIGIFEYNPALSKEEIHKETYLALYPFARAFCVNLTSSCGMPPLYITQMDLDTQNIYRIDLGGIKPNNEK